MGFIDDIVDINDEMNKRKLQLNVDKCNTMHVGPKKKCKQLKIDHWKVNKVTANSKIKLVDAYDGKADIENVNDQIYLGEVISNNGKNSKNIKEKLSRGQGAINEILFFLSETYYGEYFFEVAKLFREAFF